MAQVYDVVLREAAGTTDVMIWLRDNNWPDSADIIFFYDRFNNLRFTCSKENLPPRPILADLNNAHEYQGMLRCGNPEMGWYLNINDQWYFLYH